MDLIEFTDEFKTGLTTIDMEHSKLIDYMNEIIKAKDLGDNGRLLIEINLDELIKYTNFHFKNEEDLMLKLNDKNYPAHKKAHENLQAKVIRFKERFDANEDIIEELGPFLRDWLLKHILGTDKQYVDSFRANGVE